jgi:hypothetical protein
LRELALKLSINAFSTGFPGAHRPSSNAAMVALQVIPDRYSIIHLFAYRYARVGKPPPMAF